MITNVSYDYYTNTLGTNFPQGLFYYFLDEEHILEKQLDYSHVNTVPIAHSYSIFSICYAPFLTRANMDLEKIDYDIERFQYKFDETRIGLPPGIKPSLLRIKKVESVDNNLSYTTHIKEGIPKYNVKTRSQFRSINNESKLLMFPFSKICFYDGFNLLEVQPHKIKNNSSVFDLKVRGDITPNARYTYYVDYYKNDRYGCIEGFDGSGNMELPSSSSSYASFMASNKNQLTTGMMNNLGMGFMGSLGAGATAFATTGGNVYAGIAGFGLGLAGMGVNALTQHQQNLATIQDSRNSANSVVSTNGDVATGVGRTAGKVKLYRYTLTDSIKNQIFDFFTLYGYAQNKIMKVNTRNRYYFNYVKTTDINIKSTNIPHIYLEKIKQIFNNGTRIWHIDRENVIIGDYSMDNSEI